MIKKLLLVPAICSLTQIAPALADVDQHRTFAASALHSIVNQRYEVIAYSPSETENGSDIVLVCINQIFAEWGRPVIRSVMADETAQDEKSMSDYLNALDNVEKTRAIVTLGRSDLIDGADAVRKELEAKGEWPTVPSDLTFMTYKNYEKTYYTSLYKCLDNNYLTAVSGRIAPLDINADIDGHFVATGATEVLYGPPPSMSGIVPGAPSESKSITITDNSNVYGKTMKYSDWIKTLTNY